MADKKFFTLNTEKKIITIDTKVTPTALDKEIMQMYVMAGYIIRYKSEKRAEKARKRAEKTGFGKKKETEITTETENKETETETKTETKTKATK